MDACDLAVDELVHGELLHLLEGCEVDVAEADVQPELVRADLGEHEVAVAVRDGQAEVVPPEGVVAEVAVGVRVKDV